MNPFSISQAHQLQNVPQMLSPGKKIIAGGTNLIDLMREGVERPTTLIDINALKLNEILEDRSGVTIGALVSNADVAYNPLIGREFPLLSKAILAGASAQIRNMATTAGNILQRTRCHYFYDKATACNKREPTTGCSAMNGVNRNHAILGTSENCIAVHPSDMCVAMAALEAEVYVMGLRGNRIIPFRGFHRLPGATPELDNVLRPDEVITAIRIPKNKLNKNFAYVKVRERNSYAFALTSIAIGFELKDDKVVKARFAMGGVAHKPWWNLDAEAYLEGKSLEVKHLEKAAELLLQGAQGFGENNFKIPLANRTFVRGCQEAILQGAHS
jgi:xanthine dehydrogenase YagS FAD-binding subunit